MQMNEDGYATLPASAIIAALVFLASTLGLASGSVIAQHRAQLAADLGAVAGAWAQSRGEDACAAARKITELNGARLVECMVEGGDVQVAAQQVARAGKKAAWARAGPI